MKLKTRLTIIFLTIVILPILLTAVITVTLGGYQMRTLQSMYDLDAEDYSILSNTAQFFSGLTQNVYDGLKEDADKFPEKLEDKQYLEALNQDISGRLSYIMVRKGDEIYYCGAPAEGEILFAKLPDYGESDAELNTGIYFPDSQTLVRHVDFMFQDGSEGSVFLVTRLDNVLPEVKKLLMELLVAIFSVMVFTGAMLTFWNYQGIVSPIQKLKTATRNIKEGNLDFTLEDEGRDEIGELCADFEEMRKRLKASTEEKIQYDKENRELISNITHDLKTPITAIKGYVEGIMDGVADTPEKMDKYIKTIYNKANDMDRLINELTYYTQIDTNRIPYTFNKINVSDYFEDCIEELGMDMENKNIELNYMNYLEEDVVVIADAEQMRKVINNIVNNSVKYIDKPRGVINIRIKDVGDFVDIEIEDNGKGIAAKDLVNIFDRFYRTDVSRNSGKGGSGIGLSIVKKIIEDHGGRIWAASREGTGTTMIIELRKYMEVPASE